MRMNQPTWCRRFRLLANHPRLQAWPQAAGRELHCIPPFTHKASTSSPLQHANMRASAGSLVGHARPALPARALSSFLARLASCGAGCPMGAQGSVSTATTSEGGGGATTTSSRFVTVGCTSTRAA